MKKEQIYVGELIRKHIKDSKLTNGYVLKGLSDKGINISPPKFSNKLYGSLDKFTEQEVVFISEILNKEF